MNTAPASDVGDTRGSPANLIGAFDAVREQLLQRMHPNGFWEGRLSSSLLSTATAVNALSLAHDASDADRFRRRMGRTMTIVHPSLDGLRPAMAGPQALTFHKRHAILKVCADKVGDRRDSPSRKATTTGPACQEYSYA